MMMMGCWEKGKPVRDDLSEPVCSSIGIRLSLVSASYISFLFPSLVVFLGQECVCVCVRVWGEKMARKAFQRRRLRRLILRVTSRQDTKYTTALPTVENNHECTGRSTRDMIQVYRRIYVPLLK